MTFLGGNIIIGDSGNGCAVGNVGELLRYAAVLIIVGNGVKLSLVVHLENIVAACLCNAAGDRLLGIKNETGLRLNGSVYRSVNSDLGARADIVGSLDIFTSVSAVAVLDKNHLVYFIFPGGIGNFVAPKSKELLLVVVICKVCKLLLSHCVLRVGSPCPAEELLAAVGGYICVVKQTGDGITDNAADILGNAVVRKFAAVGVELNVAEYAYNAGSGRKVGVIIIHAGVVGSGAVGCALGEVKEEVILGAGNELRSLGSAGKLGGNLNFAVVGGIPDIGVIIDGEFKFNRPCVLIPLEILLLTHHQKRVEEIMGIEVASFDNAVILKEGKALSLKVFVIYIGIDGVERSDVLAVLNNIIAVILDLAGNIYAVLILRRHILAVPNDGQVCGAAVEIRADVKNRFQLFTGLSLGGLNPIACAVFSEHNNREADVEAAINRRVECRSGYRHGREDHDKSKQHCK